MSAEQDAAILRLQGLPYLVSDEQGVAGAPPKASKRIALADLPRRRALLAQERTDGR